MMNEKEKEELTKQTAKWLNTLKDGNDSEKLQAIGEILVGIHIYTYMEDDISLIYRDLMTKKHNNGGN
jgi:hypothetical protein